MDNPTAKNTMLTKALYFIARHSNLFSLPKIRQLRNKIYSKHFNAHQINVDKDVKIQPLHFNKYSEYQFGQSLHVGANCVIDLSGNIKIGDRVTISDGAKIFTHGHCIDGGKQNWRENPIYFSNLHIEDDVWIGANAIILPSVKKIGAGAILAAGSVASKDIEANTIVGGIPAKHLRTRRIDE